MEDGRVITIWEAMEKNTKIDDSIVHEKNISLFGCINITFAVYIT